MKSGEEDCLRYTVQREDARDKGSCSDAMGSDMSPHYWGECKRRNSWKKSRNYGWSRDALENSKLKVSGLYGKHKASGGNEPEQVPFTAVSGRQRVATV